jgi:hypothetical protein
VTNPSPATIGRARKRRLTIIAIITAVVELALYLVAHFGPALENLIRPVYFIALAIAAVTAVQALRRRPGNDRRHGDRRRSR